MVEFLVQNKSDLQASSYWVVGKSFETGSGLILFLFPECVARVPVSLGGLGVRLCSPSFAFSVATVRNRRQPFAVTP